MERVNLTGKRSETYRAWDGIDAEAISNSPSFTYEQAASIDLQTIEHACRIGLDLPASIAFEDVQALIQRIGAHRIGLINLIFETFTDGRGFTSAVRLRRDAAFTGELRATGPLAPDQALYLLRSGFDTAMVTREGRRQAFIDALSRYSAFYQTAADGAVPVSQLRQAGHADRKAS